MSQILAAAVVDVTVYSKTLCGDEVFALNFLQYNSWRSSRKKLNSWGTRAVHLENTLGSRVGNASEAKGGRALDDNFAVHVCELWRSRLE